MESKGCSWAYSLAVYSRSFRVFTEPVFPIETTCARHSQTSVVYCDTFLCCIMQSAKNWRDPTYIQQHMNKHLDPSIIFHMLSHVHLFFIILVCFSRFASIAI